MPKMPKLPKLPKMPKVNVFCLFKMIKFHNLQDNKIDVSESDTVSLIEPPLWMWVILP